MNKRKIDTKKWLLDIYYISACGYTCHDKKEYDDLQFLYDDSILLIGMLKAQQDLIYIKLYENDILVLSIDYD